MSFDSFFWLHIKKSAGITTREYLKPYYKEVDRVNKPFSFIQAKPNEFNDVLNNYRVVLGQYQFKRALFAKEFLYPDNWDKICSFAFSREPVDRCISMFYYLYYKKRSFAGNILKVYNNLKMRKKIGISLSYDFDLFLELIEIAHFESDSIYKPKGLHFSTHTAPMFGDVTDNEGNLLLKKIYRLEDLNEGIKQIFELSNINHRIPEIIYANKNLRRGGFVPSKFQHNKISKLFAKDFGIYENAGNALK